MKQQESEPTDGANPRPSGTSVMLPADPLRGQEVRQKQAGIPHRGRSAHMHYLITIVAAFAISACSAVSNGRHYQLAPSLIFHQDFNPYFKSRSFYEVIDPTTGKVIGRVASSILYNERGADQKPLVVGKSFRPTVQFSPSGRTFIITEDCWDAQPANKYLLVSFSNNKIASARYLDLPEEPSSVLGYPLQPRIVSVTDESLTLTYKDQTQRLNLQKIPSQNDLPGT